MAKLYKTYGKIQKVGGIYIEATVPHGKVGSLVEISGDHGKIWGEIIALQNHKAVIMPFFNLYGISKNSKIEVKDIPVSVYVGKGLIGKVVNAFGIPLDSNRPLLGTEPIEIKLEPINPLLKEKITEPFDTGIRAINALYTLGKGQKVGVFAAAGVGKTTTLGMITRFSQADLVILSLIGERGREVKEFVEDVLGKEGMEKSIVVVSTADEPPVNKVKAAFSSLVMARYFAMEKGLNVLFMMDSITRFAMAKRELGLASGEPPTTKGYTPSVFYDLSLLAESCGNFKKGSITGIFSVLVEGEDITDPVADFMIGVLDGHIILSRKRAYENIYPAIDPLKSISRIMPNVVPEKVYEQSQYIKSVYATYEKMEDVINLGIYKPGSNPQVDLAIRAKPMIDNFFRQGINQKVDLQTSWQQLDELYDKIKQMEASYAT
jgi:flagellum-specific ATP synthase